MEQNSVIKDYLTTATDGKEYKVVFYSLDMFLALDKIRKQGLKKVIVAV